MKIKAQVSMVLNLDKCLGCHTCSITCKNTWTNREGAEYMYFNNVETRPGVGYPRNWENQEKWKGGWTLDKSGNLALSTGSKGSRLMKLFYHPEQPEITSLEQLSLLICRITGNIVIIDSFQEVQ